MDASKRIVSGMHYISIALCIFGYIHDCKFLFHIAGCCMLGSGTAFMVLGHRALREMKERIELKQKHDLINEEFLKTIDRIRTKYEEKEKKE